MDPITLEALEYQGLKRLIAAKLRSPLGHLALEELAPSPDRGEVARRRRRATEALLSLRELRAPGPGAVEDPAEILAEIEPVGAVPEPARVSRLLAVIRAGLSWREEISSVRTRYPALWELAGAVPALRTILNDLAAKITPEGRVEDRASRQLAEIRGRIATLEGRLQRQLQQFLDRSEVREAIQDEFVTMRNGRFVIPVKVEARRGIPGIIHGSSSTGATVFVEPLEMVEANNEIVTLREEEAAEVQRILLEVGSRLRASLPELRSLCRILGEGDLVAACALLAEQDGCVAAADAEEIVLERARHPVLEEALRRREGEVVPLDVDLPGATRVLVLSGPNTGGKTVSMKTVGLLALMNQSGLLVPARSASLPVFAKILADVGDRQSITEDLSTFSARMVRVADMSGSLEPPALVLLDEVGGGTDPEEEGALAVAIVDHFRKAGAWVIATTHHGSLKAWAEMTEGVANASMEFDEEALEPTHRLIAGIAGRSGGLEMAERFGLPRPILEEARSRLGESHRLVDAYLARLRELDAARETELELAREERRHAESERAASNVRASGEEAALRERYERAIAAALESIGKRAEDLEKRLTDRAAALQLRSEARRETQRAREEAAAALGPPAPVHARPPVAPPAGYPPGPSPLTTGARVHVRSLRAEGLIQSVNDRRHTVELIVRGKRMTVAEEDCEPIAGAGAALPRVPESLPSGVTFEAGGAESVASEINLIGRTLDEARGMLEKFLDSALLAGHREVRIVHGHGTGRLRKAVGEILSGHALVEEHHPADPRFGGAAVTVAKLRD